MRLTNDQKNYADMVIGKIRGANLTPDQLKYVHRQISQMINSQEGGDPNRNTTTETI